MTKIGAWIEMLKLGASVRGLKKEVRFFYRNSLINSLLKEGWFDFLSQPRTAQDVCDHFGYTDMQFLTRVLDVFTNDGVLIREDDRYRSAFPVEPQPVKLPRFFGAAMKQITLDGAASFPDRLKGRYGTFSDGMNLFNWDDTLGLELYERLRMSAFRFSHALNRRGRFLDVGCGNGTGTAAIWGYYNRRKAFGPGSKMEIYGLEPDEGLRSIAAEEFPVYASRLVKLDRSVIEGLKEYHPRFVAGYAENIPFDDEYFDMVYTSQVLHWCNGEQATKEMMRVLKPGGLFFGTESFHPSMDPYVELFTLVNEGAGGVIRKEDFERWVREAGAVSVGFATPTVAFKVIKKSAS
ncbi:MAG: methyltransferase domain-containing protein [Candidatus Thorarchaeota archaeon]|nr:methyltransferase domain-containing protein [Candidatus Thorarchaeota archaeon]